GRIVGRLEGGGQERAPEPEVGAGAGAEREGFEPPSPFGRSLSRRVHYRSASAPREGRGGGAEARVVGAECSPRGDCRGGEGTGACAPRPHPSSFETRTTFSRTSKQPSGRPDSNRGPLRPERSALPD